MDAEALAASMFVPHSNPRVEAGRLVRAIQVCHHVIRIFDKRQSVLAADNDFLVVEPATVSARVVPPRRNKVNARRGMPPPDPPTVEQVESALSLSSKNETSAAKDHSWWSRHASPDHKKRDATDDSLSSLDDAKATKKAKTCSQGVSSYSTTQSSSRWSYN